MMATGRALQKVLILGSGRTCPPIVELLTRDEFLRVTVASDEINQAKSIASTYPHTSATGLDVQSETNLLQLITDHNLVISMVPNQFHPLVAKQCIATRVPMVTSSYVSSDLAVLHEAVQEAGICVLNECGVDPGIDHMLAMACIDKIHAAHGQIMYFESWCGGLPHAKFANNPLRYKFSWNPLGVLKSACNPAQYLSHGRVVEISDGGAVMKEAKLMSNIIEESLIPLEGYPNRDSLKYRDLYGIPEAHTVIRGTLRYQGYCQTMSALLELGLLNDNQMPRLQPDAAKITWNDLMTMLISQTDIRQSDLSSSILEALQGDKEKYKAINDLGLLSTEPVNLQGTPMKALAAHLEKRLELGSNEYDTVILQHRIGIETFDKKKEEHRITLYMDGEQDGFTAMAKLVGKPAAIAAKMVLSGQIQQKGVLRPLTADIYQPALKALKEEGIEYKVEVVELS